MKKFLSLVLALIMTMSLVTISAGATEYRDLTDKDEIQYEEAVAVLNRIGVITGYEDGSFRPEGELTRGAAAKIIVSLLIGPEAAANLPNTTAPYPDVPASHTFAGVISYCKTAKIISGYGDGTFKPGNSLTGFAFAKMLLGALGYKQEIEGFVDTGWTMNVAKVGNVTGLFDRLDFDGAAAVNRETACQLALNTLKATMVTYGGTTVVTGAQALAVQGTQAMYVTSNNREINANINRRVINAVNNEMTLEFGEEHFKDLRLEHDKYDPAYDEYGHPSNEWSWKKVTIGTFKLPADFTFEKQMSHLEDTAATKEKALGLRNYDTWSTDHRVTATNWSTASSSSGWRSPFADATQITINGWNARVGSNGKISDYDASVFNGRNSKPDGVPTIAEIADLTDNGVTVEVYVCPVDADFITNVVVTRTQLMKVKRIGSDFITLEDIEPDSRDPRKEAKLADITGFNNFAIDVTENYDAPNKNSFLADVKDSNYDAYNALKDMKVGDRVAVIPYTTDNGLSWEVGEAYAPETVTGAFTKVDTYANVNKREGSAVAITVGGTSYPINEWNKDMLDVKGPEIKATKKDVTLYLAKDGTVLWADEIGDSDAWMIVGDYYQATNANLSGKVGWYVHGWTIGGAEVDLDLGTIRGDAEKYAPGELVHYYIAEDGNGEYALEKPNYLGINHYKNGGDADDFSNKNGEGIYEVSQYTFDAADNTKAKQYQISKRNGALALENYDTTNVNPPYKYTLAMTTPTSDPAPAPATPVKHEDKTDPSKAAKEKPHEFKYSNLLYDGVKFIFVNFDGANGEVETIDFKDGVQNVDYQDLVRYNNLWKNIGTNDGQKFVVSSAEAYVNSKGLVKAVVIKADSSEADLSKVAVITDTPGDKNLQKPGAEGDRTNGLSYAKQYVTGPSFSLSEEKTGYFDKDYPIGTILVISEKENIIVGKYFHSTYYNNGNPDALYVEGIKTLKDTKGNDSEAGFLIGQTGSVVKTLNGKHDLTYDGVTNPEVVPGEDRIVDILGQKYVSGFDTMVTGDTKDLSGLIRVDGNTTFVDLRAINTDTIESMGDLLDYKPETVKLRLLVNGNDSTDTFRRAYAVIVEKAEVKDGVSTTAGNVTLDKDSAAVAVNKKFGNVSVNRFSGLVSWNVAFEAPDWATKNGEADLTFDVDIIVDGKVLATAHVKNSAGLNETELDKNGDVFSASDTAQIPSHVLNNGLIDLNNVVVSGVIKNVTWKNANVEFKFADGSDASALVTGAATQKMAIGSANKATFNPTFSQGSYTGTPTFTLKNATTTTALPAATLSFADAYAEGGKAVIVEIGGLTAPAPAATYKVDSNNTGTSALLFQAVDSVPAQANIPESGWASDVTAAAGKVILIKAATTGAKLTGVTGKFNPDTGAALGGLSISEIPTSTGVFQFTMPANNVRIGAVTTDAVTVEGAYISKDYKNLFVKTNAAPKNTAEELEAIAKFINDSSAYSLDGVTAKANPALGGGTITITKGGQSAELTPTIAATHVTTTIDTHAIIVPSTANLSNALSYEGITMPTNTHVKKTVAAGTISAVAQGSLTGETSLSGNTYDTNVGLGYIQLADTPVTASVTVTGGIAEIGGTTETVGAALVTVSSDDGFTATNQYVKVGATLGIKLTPSGALTIPTGKKVQAVIAANNTATVGGYGTAADVPGLGADASFETTGVELAFTLSNPTAAKIDGLAVTLSAANAT